MEMFGTFDDSVFEEARDKVSVALSSYNAKICEPEWFCESTAVDTEETLEKQKVYKFRADLAFRQGKYQKSLEDYRNCLAWIPDNNLTIKRDVLEGMARCCLNLGQREKALELTDALSKEASNTCHLTCLLLLKISIHHHFGAAGAKMAVLEQLCCLHPYNAWHWLSLAQTCLGLLETAPIAGESHCSAVVQLDSPAEPQPESQTEHQQEDNRKEREEMEDRNRVWLKACMCFTRARLLLDSFKQQQSSFVLQRSESALCRSEEALQRLELKESSLQLITEVMSEDLLPEKMREDNQDGDSLAGLSLKSFRDRWWNKLLCSGVLEADGPALQQ
ncbi:uncharacterized protein C8orf76 homolog [Aplochiton taeniatus]